MTAGITRLMDDLGSALAGKRDILMLGGGNPAHIPEVQKYFRQSVQKLLNTRGAFERAVDLKVLPQALILFEDRKIAPVAQLDRATGYGPVG